MYANLKKEDDYKFYIDLNALQSSIDQKMILIFHNVK